MRGDDSAFGRYSTGMGDLGFAATLSYGMAVITPDRGYPEESISPDKSIDTADSLFECLDDLEPEALAYPPDVSDVASGRRVSGRSL